MSNISFKFTASVSVFNSLAPELVHTLIATDNVNMNMNMNLIVIVNVNVNSIEFVSCKAKFVECLKRLRANVVMRY